MFGLHGLAYDRYSYFKAKLFGLKRGCIIKNIIYVFHNSALFQIAILYISIMFVLEYGSYYLILLVIKHIINCNISTESARYMCFKLCSNYSRTSVARTLMALLPRLFRTRS